jgi:PEP-CTERM motif
LGTPGNTGVFFQRSQGVLGAGPYASNDPRATDTLSIIWRSDFGTNPFASQLSLYSLDSEGGFAARFNYGLAADATDNPLIGSFGGYSLGSATGSWSEPISSAVDRTFTFAVDGGGDDGGEVSVPEPSTLLLLACGLLGLSMQRRRASHSQPD